VGLVGYASGHHRRRGASRRQRRRLARGTAARSCGAACDSERTEATLKAYEEEVRRGVTLARALGIVEAIERSEINVVFDTLNGSVDMRSRARFERFFVLTQRHLAYCSDQVQALRTRHRIALESGA
jgi:hypothetical protein